MAEILPIRRKTLSNQSINQSINQVRFFRLTVKGTSKTLFLNLNSSEFFSIEKMKCLSFYMHMKFLQNLQRFGFALHNWNNNTDSCEWSVIETSDSVCDCLLMKYAINPLSTVIILGNWGFINLQLMLPVQRIDKTERYRGSSAESETNG